MSVLLTSTFVLLLAAMPASSSLSVPSIVLASADVKARFKNIRLSILFVFCKDSVFRSIIKVRINYSCKDNFSPVYVQSFGIRIFVCRIDLIFL